jgi:hypothetical protein
MRQSSRMAGVLQILDGWVRFVRRAQGLALKGAGPNRTKPEKLKVKAETQHRYRLALVGPLLSRYRGALALLSWIFAPRFNQKSKGEFRMTRFICLAAYLIAALCTRTSFAQPLTDQSNEASPETTPAFVANVYVANTVNPEGSPPSGNVYAYTATADGKLTRVPGSPFDDNVGPVAANAKYLFGGVNFADFMDTFSIATDGAIQRVSADNTGGCGGVMTHLDQSGAFLYNMQIQPNCASEEIQVFSIDQTNGKLNSVSSNISIGNYIYDFEFLGTNEYAYAPIDNASPGAVECGLVGFKRLSNGKLTQINLGNPLPTPPQSGDVYCPSGIATDKTNHVFAVLVNTNANGESVGEQAVGVFTAGANGSLTTTSTYLTMPKAPTAPDGNGMSISPSGKLLAVGGYGVEIFQLNGENPVTPFLTLLSDQTILGLAWDRYDHLYVTEGTYENGGRLYVYTITPTGFSPAPGSPYAIPNPTTVTIQQR